MGSQALPAAPPSVDNISCVSVTRTNAHPFSLDTSRRNNRNLSTTTTDNDNHNTNNNNSVRQPRTKYLVRYTRYSWNPYYGVQIENAVNPPEYSYQRPSGALPSSPSSDFRSCCCCSHCQALSPVVALPRHGCVNHTSGVESAAQRSPAFRVHPMPVARVLANGGDPSNGSTAKSVMLEEMLRDFRERLRHPRPAMHCL